MELHIERVTDVLYDVVDQAGRTVGALFIDLEDDSYTVSGGDPEDPWHSAGHTTLAAALVALHRHLLWGDGGTSADQHE